LLLDEPTNHLYLESITADNDGLKSFKGSIIFTSYDFEYINTISNSVIDLNKQCVFSKEITYE
ncbi:ABC transporter ATP-binding protein, partial [Staphylococcus aureus]|nr:ABC transporter ATP-binding protein [Staphylococcus aureus]